MGVSIVDVNNVENIRVFACMVEPICNDALSDDTVRRVEIFMVLPCVVEKDREFENRGAVTVLTVIEEPTVVDTVNPLVKRLETDSVEAALTVLITSNPPSMVETVRGLVYK